MKYYKNKYGAIFKVDDDIIAIYIASENKWGLECYNTTDNRRAMSLDLSTDGMSEEDVFLTLL